MPLFDLPSVSHPTDRPNFYLMDYGPMRVWFSYETPIAFAGPGYPRTVRENDWSVTTGKHLNYIDDGNKSARVTGEEFERRLRDSMEQARLAEVKTLAQVMGA